MRPNKGDTCKTLANKTMSREIYDVRRMAMAFVYEARALVPDLPRIQVRITEDHDTVLAIARMRDCKIWISERSVDFDLRTIVFHEILHAVFGATHDESCPLMGSVHRPLSRDLASSLFSSWAKRLRKD